MQFAIDGLKMADVLRHTEDFKEISMREGEILTLVVSAYIENSTPVSSLYITDRFDIGLSSATVRSVFAELENKGYLYSPHRSAGRIPTEKGYRYFTENLSAERLVPEEDKRLIQEEYLKRSFQLDQILDVTSRILSMLTNCVGIVIGPERDKTVLKHIELIDMGQDELLIILVTRSGMVYSKILYLDNRIPGKYLREISGYLNNLFKGCDLSEIKNRLKTEDIGPGARSEYYSMIVKTIAANIESVHGDEEIFTAGIDKLIEKMNGEIRRPEAIGLLFEKEALLKGIFQKTGTFNDVMICIDGDVDERFAGLSIVGAGYKMGDSHVGSLGIIGPNRMDYNRTVSLVDFVRRLLSHMLTKISN